MLAERSARRCPSLGERTPSSVGFLDHRFSVYDRIVATVLHEKSVSFERETIDPFAATVLTDYPQRHLFGRVLVLSHDVFDVFETTTIARCADTASAGPFPMSGEPKSFANMVQGVSIIEAYGCRPMVRQKCTHRVFRPWRGADGRGVDRERTGGVPYRSRRAWAYRGGGARAG